jgi:nucleoside-diphosphate-sugar epimerase
MRVLVTGHAGYVGSVLAPLLDRAGHDVVGLDSSYFADCMLGPAPPSPPLLSTDVRDVTEDDLRGFDAVCHLAGLSNDAVGNLDPELTYEINHRASFRLARVAKEAGVGRFLFASSCSIYGVTGGDELVDESAPLKPLPPYAESKARVEEDLVALADDGFSPVLLRNATIYGYSPRFRADLVLNNLVAWAHVSGETRVTSDGTPCRPVVHVEDVARAALAALEADRDAVHAEAFNVGSARDNYRVRELAEIVEGTVSGATVVITGETGPDPRSYRVDFSKVERVLPAFRPAWDPRRGARELYDAFVRFELTRERLEREFTRLARLSELSRSGRLDETLRWRGPERAAASA